MPTSKARKVRGLHVDCVACGTTNVVNAETGEVEGIAREAPPPAPAPANDPPAPAPSGESGSAAPPAAQDDDGGFLADW